MDFNKIDKELVIKITNLMPESAKKLISGKAENVIKQIGIDVIQNIVLDVLCGKNLRDSTEALTRKRLATLNAATLLMFLRGQQYSEQFAVLLPVIAAEGLKQKLPSNEKHILQWILGLTDKATQNVLRDSIETLDNYRDEFTSIYKDIVTQYELEFGDLNGYLELEPDKKAKIDWYFMVLLLGTIGSQTLAIRGSEKSTYGKLFERLILGSLLTILGFDFVSMDSLVKPKKVFWLSSTGDKRESDATLLYDAGKGVRFDIGFIGRGNPEISLDKVSRFEREADYGRSNWYMATIILVDNIGKGSRIEELARAIDGTIIQMSMAYWPKQIAQVLHDKLGLTHPLVDMPDKDIFPYLQSEISKVPIEQFLASNSQPKRKPR